MSPPFFVSDFSLFQSINENPKSVFEAQDETYARVFRFSKFTELLPPRF